MPQKASARREGCRHPDCNGQFLCPGSFIPRLPITDAYFLCVQNMESDKRLYEKLTEGLLDRKPKPRYEAHESDFGDYIMDRETDTRMSIRDVSRLLNEHKP